MQERLIRRNPKTITRLAQHKRFRAAFDFLCLRAESETELGDCAAWWSAFQEQDDAQQNEMIQGLPRPQRKRRRRAKHRTAE